MLNKITISTLMQSILILTISLVSISAFAAKKPIIPSPEKIAAHSYAWIGPLDVPKFENNGYRMNLGFVVGTKGIVVIDTGYTEAMATEMLAHIRKISPLPIVAAINTNSQPHRFFGNRIFHNAGAKIISSALEKKRMQEQSGAFIDRIQRVLKLKENSIAAPFLPDTLISKPTAIELGGVEIVINVSSAAHTPQPLMVHVKQDNLVYAGDILYGERLLSILPASNVKQWIGSYQALANYGNATLVPGHGRPGPLSAFKFSTHRYLQGISQHMDKSVDEGLDAQDAINSFDQSAYRELVNFEILKGPNASWAYLEAEAAAFE